MTGCIPILLINTLIFETTFSLFFSDHILPGIRFPKELAEYVANFQKEQRQQHSASHHRNLPEHNFWPYFPINDPITENGDKRQHFFQLPTHNFWPWIPVKPPNERKEKKSHSQLPDHGFWPFFPMPKVNSTEKAPAPAPPMMPPSRYNYVEVLYKSILFYEVQRSGRLPKNRKVRWRGHSALRDRGHHGEDLTGGWYDAGDYIKFGVPMATATTMLLWGLIEYGDAYKAAALMPEMRDCVKWPLDYFIKAHIKKYELYGQLGDPYLDHTYWGRPEDMNLKRPAYKVTTDSPGSDLVADTAAAMAAGFIAFKDVDPPYAKKLLEHAKDLFEFADHYRGGYSDSIPNAVEFYRSYTDEDELAWAAIWLYKATRNKYFLNKAKHYADQMDGCWAQSWADKACAVPLLLYQMTRERRYKMNFKEIMAEWLPGGGGVDYTPKGLAYISPWGTLRYTANMAFLAIVAADLGIEPVRYRRWAMGQIHYMLGDGGRSYVIGYGKNPPTRPHHASSSCPSPPETCSWADYKKTGPNEHVLFGALVGGPDLNDEFEDERDDYIHNEVGTEYNAGFQSAVAGLKQMELTAANP